MNDYAVFDELLVYGPKFVFFFTFTIWINVVDSWFLDSLTLTLHISKTYLSNAFQVYRIQIFSITVRNFSNFYRSMEIKVTLIPTFVRNQNPRRKMRQSMRMTNLMPNMCQDHPKDEVLLSMKPSTKRKFQLVKPWKKLHPRSLPKRWQHQKVAKNQSWKTPIRNQDLCLNPFCITKQSMRNPNWKIKFCTQSLKKLRTKTTKEQVWESSKSIWKLCSTRNSTRKPTKISI